MTNPTTRELTLVEAALKAAANWLRRNANAEKEQAKREAFIEGHNAIRSLDPAAIVASVPGPTRQPETAQDDRRKKWQELDYSFNAERAGLHTFHVEAFEAGLELAADWHLLVIWLGCMFDFDTAGSVNEVAASAAATTATRCGWR